MEEFIVHGYYTVSNAGGYEIMLSDDGELAKVRNPLETDQPSEWLPIMFIFLEEDDDESVPVIDPDGYHIPPSLVMKS